ncbi:MULTISPECIES: hypothetical protein [Shewanella]|uniref:Uncharacterized protein n=1 Tax=Shewanella scandinavica TaxID=3063538 RepID=A0ABU3FYC8_9GAMM|nr:MULTISPECIES: hypothetical protein [Shewanella]ABS08237.1 conserved hypothetical protein [Shewanella baltica OS185]MDT3280387.1 hypothetical protein [Shewanella sp. SP2S1-2]
MNGLEQMTLEQVENGSLNLWLPNCTLGLQRDLYGRDYDSFINCIYETLDLIISRIDMHPHLRARDSEDRTTLEMVNAFRFTGILAEQDAYYNGNCDFSINFRDNFVWLGEAKLDNSNTHIMEGFRQLVDRYVTGSKVQKEGALLIYCRLSNPTEVLQKWRDYLLQKETEESEYSIRFLEDPLEEGARYFYTVHRHKSSGQLFKVKHLTVSLHDVASDKSAKTRKNCSHSCLKCCK